jgi:L-ornithine N5-oxygenase
MNRSDYPWQNFDCEIPLDYSENLIISPGGSARMPSAVSMISPHHKIIHSSIYSTSIHSILSSIASSRSASVELSHHPFKVAVVGGGQSAAEIVIDLRSKLQDVFPLLPNGDGGPARHEIDLIISRGSLKPVDGSPFSNEIFDPTCAYVNIYPPGFRLI